MTMRRVFRGMCNWRRGGLAGWGRRALSGLLLACGAVSGAAAAVDDLRVDADWGDSGYAAESFLNDQIGEKLATLGNGNTVTLSRGSNASSPLQALLLQRSPSGAIVPWADVPPVFSGGGGAYIVYPNNALGASSLDEVVDLKVYEGRIYVLLTVSASTGSRVPLVRCFTATGADCGWFSQEFSGDPEQAAIAFDIFGDRIEILARNGASGSAGFRVARWEIASDGSFSHLSDVSFSSPGGNPRAEPVDIAARRPSNPYSTSYRGYFVAYTRKFSSDPVDLNYDPCLLSVKSDDSPGTDLAGGSVLCRPFDEPESSLADVAVELRTRSWEDAALQGHFSIEVMARVDRRQAEGVGVWRIVDGQPDVAFGALGGPAGQGARGQGRVVWGGCGPLASGGSDVGLGCHRPTMAGIGQHLPAAFTAMGPDLVLVGLERWTIPVGSGSANDNSPMLFRVELATGALKQFDLFDHPGFSGHQEFRAILGRLDGRALAVGSAFVLSGGGTWHQPSTALTRGLFADGFE